MILLLQFIEYKCIMDYILKFPRFAYENKLTLSVFVNMSLKISKHILKRKIICLPPFPVPAVSGA